ncbi:PIN domain-containing protein [Iningainema tapete]|uniref:PIN domain-containing protein n=1 Tax=Iningainema tapete BLCC-T55 TaxID=2748662 RepID=A0A8J6XSV4_9CYAN|nr:PIN domain-containing protein [Iningainema tapete]MBD2773083.1 PIN domain-containing protein [Iningainema tapete BLCC-T55]
MNKEIILLDSGPLSLITHANSQKEVVIKCQQWFRIIIKKYFVYIPEIADYEVRRELIHQKLKKGIERLNEIENLENIQYIPITTEIMLKAAELWAWARSTGQQTASKEALDGDVILAATAIITSQNQGNKVIIATTNVGHLQRYHTDTRNWEDKF